MTADGRWKRLAPTLPTTMRCPRRLRCCRRPMPIAKTKRPACGPTCLATPTLWPPRLPTVLTCTLWASCDLTRQPMRVRVCPGIAYTHALTRQLMERAADSQIVQEQLAPPRDGCCLRASLSMDSKAWISGSMFSRDEAERVLLRCVCAALGSRRYGPFWYRFVPCWTLTFRALVGTSTSATSWPKRRPQISQCLHMHTRANAAGGNACQPAV